MRSTVTAAVSVSAEALRAHHADVLAHRAWIARRPEHYAIGEIGAFPLGMYQLAIPVAQAASRIPSADLAMLMAISQQESSFDPNARPYTKDPRLALKKRGVPVKINGRYVRSSALGYFQVLDGSLSEFGLTPAQRTDPNAATRGAAQALGRYGKLIDSAFPGLPRDVRAGWVYVGHWRGQRSLKRAIAAVKSKRLAPTLENAAAVLGVPVGPLRNVQRYYSTWEAARADLGGNWNGLVAWAQTNAPGGAVLASRRGGRGATLASRNASAGSSGGGAILVLGAIGLGLVAFLATRKR